MQPFGLNKFVEIRLEEIVTSSEFSKRDNKVNVNVADLYIFKFSLKEFLEFKMTTLNKILNNSYVAIPVQMNRIIFRFS